VNGKGPKNKVQRGKTQWMLLLNNTAAIGPLLLQWFSTKVKDLFHSSSPARPPTVLPASEEPGPGTAALTEIANKKNSVLGEG
jgi:hypothetical protein